LDLRKSDIPGKNSSDKVRGLTLAIFYPKTPNIPRLLPSEFQLLCTRGKERKWLKCYLHLKSQPMENESWLMGCGNNPRLTAENVFCLTCAFLLPSSIYNGKLIWIF
jgi:hypothetical protein